MKPILNSSSEIHAAYLAMREPGSVILSKEDRSVILTGRSIKLFHLFSCIRNPISLKASDRRIIPITRRFLTTAMQLRLWLTISSMAREILSLATTLGSDCSSLMHGRMIELIVRDIISLIYCLSQLYQAQYRWATMSRSSKLKSANDVPQIIWHFLFLV